MPKPQPQLGIRLPGDIKERIRCSAEANRRSMNSEIIVLLERALAHDNEKADAAGTASA